VNPELAIAVVDELARLAGRTCKRLRSFAYQAPGHSVPPQPAPSAETDRVEPEAHRPAAAVVTVTLGARLGEIRATVREDELAQLGESLRVWVELFHRLHP
jgi:hypothetical protein